LREIDLLSETIRSVLREIDLIGPGLRTPGQSSPHLRLNNLRRNVSVHRLRFTKTSTPVWYENRMVVIPA